jgi:N-acetyl-gamma-glutamyl-phosphate reductase
MIWVGIIGAKGYFGETLSKLVAGHPDAQVSTVVNVEGLYGDSRQLGYLSMVDAIRKSDVIFSGLPGEMAEDVYLKALSHGKKIIDISEEHNSGMDFTNTADNAYLGSIYGLSELYKDKMKGAFIASNPSSYCTGALLGLAPIALNGFANMASLDVRTKSGISSLKRNDKLTDLGMIKNGARTYKLEGSGYAAEVSEQMLNLFGKGTLASYESYVISGTKGIVTTIKADPLAGISSSDISDAYRDFYKGNPFVEVSGNMANVAQKGFGKHFCKINASLEADTGKISVTTVLNDAIRGVAGQAIQTMNLMYGMDGSIGL